MTTNIESMTSMELTQTMVSNVVSDTEVKHEALKELIGFEFDPSRMVGTIDKKNMTWTCKQISKMITNGSINFNHIVQRSLVWEKERKTKLIESILIGFPIPVVWAKQNVDTTGEIKGRSNKVYFVLDGKQRLVAIYGYMNDEYALTDLKPISYEDDMGEVHTVDISGKKFSELPTELQDIINCTNISINYFDTLDSEGERELFNRLNNGKPLSTKAKLVANCKDIEGIMTIGKHPLFEDMLSTKSKEGKAQITLVMKAWCMLNQNISDVSFASKDFNPLVEETQISDDEIKVMNEVFDYLVETHEICVGIDKKLAKKLYKETNIISLIPFVVEAINKEISEDDFADFIYEFFFTGDKNTSNSNLYNESSASGTARHANIVGRHTALEEKFNEYFEIESDDEEYVEAIVEDDYSDEE